MASRTRPPRTDPIRRLIFASCPVMTGSARAAKPTRGPLARFDPSRAAPLPARLGPVRPEPRFDRPPEPDHADPGQLGPIRPEPRAAPVRAGPVRAGGRAAPSRPPVRTEPVRLGFTLLPVRADPVRAGPPPRTAVRPPSGSRPPSRGRPFWLGDAAREPPPTRRHCSVSPRCGPLPATCGVSCGGRDAPRRALLRCPPQPRPRQPPGAPRRSSPRTRPCRGRLRLPGQRGPGGTAAVREPVRGEPIWFGLPIRAGPVRFDPPVRPSPVRFGSIRCQCGSACLIPRLGWVADVSPPPRPPGRQRHLSALFPAVPACRGRTGPPRWPSRGAGGPASSRSAVPGRTSRRRSR